ncbi:hypothetical protein [Methanothermococcus okinawensis]|uniref:Uncharacterized protein n=1 Tax=Methanothermococcus okinawensis (strain DSM 14208 / JCM 11175 / IH1) TaxID=647113 RepID=F8AKF6_METOI|nr:hypothetical protein [Methanothermococcus okinawensis]AEH07482.1 hypothetical protein Metok_1519 [Methanothermococcus okinawensis IH1]
MFKKIKKAIGIGNDKPPVQIPVEEDEYIVIGDEPAAYELKDDKEIPLQKHDKELNMDFKEPQLNLEKSKDISTSSTENSKPEVKIITKKIMPKILTTRVKSPEDFENLKTIVEHDIIIINLEDVPVEAIEKEFLDFKKYLETLNYNLGKIDENVILAIKSGINIDKYTSTVAE